jgi:DNA-binding CsgD family transcriptional regulator
MARMTVETAGITPREKQVLALIIDGHSNANIGLLLGIGRWTVVRHIQNLFDKAGCDSRLQLAMKFYQGEPNEDKVAVDFDARATGILSDVVQGRN